MAIAHHSSLVACGTFLGPISPKRASSLSLLSIQRIDLHWFFGQCKGIGVAWNSRIQGRPGHTSGGWGRAGVSGTTVITVEGAWHVFFEAQWVIFTVKGAAGDTVSVLFRRVVIWDSCWVFWEHFKFKWFDLVADSSLLARISNLELSVKSDLSADCVFNPFNRYTYRAFYLKY